MRDVTTTHGSFFLFQAEGTRGNRRGLSIGLEMEAVWYHITYVWGSLGFPRDIQ